MTRFRGHSTVGSIAPGDVHDHSDRGVQYTSLAYGRRCQEAGLVPSMGSAGDAYDNAIAEALFDYIEGWYNPHRRHSALGYLSPAEFEEAWQPPDAVPDTVSVKMARAAGG